MKRFFFRFFKNMIFSVTFSLTFDHIGMTDSVGGGKVRAYKQVFRQFQADYNALAPHPKTILLTKTINWSTIFMIELYVKVHNL